MEPEKTRHEKMKSHLRAATRKLHEQQLRIQEQTAAHLAKNPVVPVLAPTPEVVTSTDESGDADV